MIKRETIEEFIQLMVEHDLVELDVADGDQSITLRRANPQAQPVYTTAVPPAAAGAGPASTASPASDPGGADPGRTVAAEAPTAEGMTVNSPMVGTFYSRPNPDSDAFVGIGSKVTESTVVCLIEAMKVFNEIKAECKGEVTEILVEDGDPVEYGQPLFRVRPA